MTPAQAQRRDRLGGLGGGCQSLNFRARSKRAAGFASTQYTIVIITNELILQRHPQPPPCCIFPRGIPLSPLGPAVSSHPSPFWPTPRAARDAGRPFGKAQAGEEGPPGPPSMAEVMLDQGWARKKP